MTMLEDWYGSEQAAQMRQEMPRVAKTVTMDGFDAMTTEDKATAAIKMNLVIAKLKMSVAKSRVLTSLQVPPTVSFLVPILGMIVGSTPTEVKNAVLGGLNQMDRLIDLRLVNMRDAVLSGQHPLAKWLVSADEIGKGITSIMKELKESSSAALFQAQYNDVKADLQRFWDKASEIAPKLGLGLGAGALVALGIAAFVFWNIYVKGPAPRRLSGYRRRRRLAR